MDEKVLCFSNDFLALLDVDSSPPQQKSRKIGDQEDSFSICFEGSTQNSNLNGHKPSSQCKVDMDLVDTSGCIKSHSKNDLQVTGIKNIVQTENPTNDDKKKVPNRKIRHVGEFL